MDKLEIIQAIVVTILMIFILLGTTIIVLEVLEDISKPFQDCTNKTDNYTISVHDKNFTCGQINAINQSVLKNSYAGQLI